MRRKLTCIDIYCGAGGSSFGAAQAGAEVRYGLDRDSNAIRTFVANHPDAYGDCRDVAAVSAREILKLSKLDRVDLLLSGPNCQAVSTMGLFYDRDPRNLLFVHLARLIDEFRTLGKAPGTVVVENVPGIAFNRNVGLVKELFRFFLDRGYRCAADVVNFATWGLPQLRYRFVLVATLVDVAPTLPAPVASVDTGEGLVTAWEAISDLTDLLPVPAGETCRRKLLAADLSPYQKSMVSRRTVIHNHHVGRTAPIDIARIAKVPPGGCWKDIPEELMPERFRHVRMTDYKTLYGRIREDHPAYTLSASFANVTSGCFTHPRHDRALSVREGCRIQGFPDSFVVTGPVPSQYRQIGNAVPAYAARVLVEHWQRVLDGGKVASVQPRLDEELLFGSTKRKFPILTPRYQRIGYGSGTYWPKGWGEKPDSTPDSSTGYRISTEPVSFRRRGWRLNREEGLDQYAPLMKLSPWGHLVSMLSERIGQTPVLFESAETLEDATRDTNSARDHFMAFLAPVAAAIVVIARARRRLTVICDFGMTADWLTLLLNLLVKRDRCSIRIIDQNGVVLGMPEGRSAVRLVVNSAVLPEGTDVAIVAPFGDMLKSLALTQRAQGSLSPCSRVRVSLLVTTTRKTSRRSTESHLAISA
ncbi:MAG TPA: DNA cytosine methyltransferase [Candidatus Binatia bacterium]|nr:DNA cytosine methyltransferase [Candidatus Binatia bacterium]